MSNDRDLVSLIVSYMLLQNAVNHKVAWPIICMKVTHKLGFAFGLHLLHSESSTEAYLKPWVDPASFRFLKRFSCVSKHRILRWTALALYSTPAGGIETLVLNQDKKI